jgi:hypothetical protein
MPSRTASPAFRHPLPNGSNCYRRRLAEPLLDPLTTFGFRSAAKIVRAGQPNRRTNKLKAPRGRNPGRLPSLLAVTTFSATDMQRTTQRRMWRPGTARPIWRPTTALNASRRSRPFFCSYRLPKGQVPPYEVHLLKERENEPSLHCFRGREVFCFWTPREGGATAQAATHRRGASAAGCTRPPQAAYEPAIEGEVSTAVDLDGRNQRRKGWRRLDGTTSCRKSRN